MKKNYGLSEKKQHEIIYLAPLVANVCTKGGSNQVIDIGAGLVSILNWYESSETAFGDIHAMNFEINIL